MLVITNKGRNMLASEPTYHTTKCVLEKLPVIEINKVNKTNLKMSKPVYLGMSILDIIRRYPYMIIGMTL